MSEHDVVIVGGGAAGLSAALVLGRARRRVAIVDAGEPRNAPARHMQGFLSREGMPPAELLAAGRAEVTGYGVELVAGTVDRIEPGFAVQLGGGRMLAARRVLVATGLRDEIPDIPGLRQRWARTVLHCPYCHGYEVRDRPLGVIASAEHALLLCQWSPDVVYFPHTSTVSDEDRARLTARGVRIVEGEVARIADGEAQMADGTTIDRQAFFVRPRFVPTSNLLSDLGAAVEAGGWAVVDSTGRTSVPGVWAAGNAVDPRAQVITAAGQGSAAAIAINNDLVNDDIAQALTVLGPEPEPTF
ncbi:NAD(P)/FAD-dependent oxidoreductase [Salinispora arenicola]|uniref:NAD(P)/FAD-dependent oxidoreductase n=1 Tax=Salinispora arenicola TaxID=168697 RepID=UPI0004838B3C|nr:NAD(P)/FAD-dependent oxidoreductase [Salinispora arenicola]